MNIHLFLIIIGIIIVASILLALLIFGKGEDVRGNGGYKRGGNVNLGMKDEMLQLHNQVRSKNGALPLKWNDELSIGAQKWVDYLKNNENCNMRHPTSSQEEMNKYLNNNTWGQNIAWFSGNSQGSPQACFDGWVTKECPNYNPNNPGDRSKGDVGHYTQIVWKNTTDVGCAKASCGNQTLWACNYSPAGNIRMNNGFSEYISNVEKNC